MFDALSLLHEMRSVKIRKHSRILLRAERGLLGSSSVERWTVELGYFSTTGRNKAGLQLLGIIVPLMFYCDPAF